MPKKTQKIRNVIVAVNLADASWRDFLTGFFDYARTGVHWNIRLLQSADELSREAGDLICADGIVSGIRADDATAAALSETKVPLVLIGMEDERLTRRAGTTVIRNDNVDIGAFAARHFLTLGKFNSFGFVTTNTDEPWSALRAQGFQKTLAADGLDLHQFRTNFVPGSSEDLARLARWVRELPKPAAVFAAYDRRAIHVLSACKDVGLSVPGQVAVIGVDNDRLLCDFSDPPLTSIAPDHEEEGRIAAQTLDDTMNGRLRGKSRTMLMSGKRVVERDSARPTTPATALIRRAITYIERCADKNIKAPDVATYLGVSRSLLDVRFKESRGETVSDAITTARLTEVKRRLRKTNQSIRSITKECGFANPNHLKNLFKRHFGISMRDYRNARLSVSATSAPCSARAPSGPAARQGHRAACRPSKSPGSGSRQAGCRPASGSRPPDRPSSSSPT